MGRHTVWRGHCEIAIKKTAPQPQIDYTNQLSALISLGNQILGEVTNYNSRVSVDLSPVMADLSRILESLNRLPDVFSMSSLGVSSSISRLQSEFATIVDAIEGFSSAQMLFFQALGDGISATITKESDQVESLLIRLLDQQEGQKMKEYSHAHLVGDGGCLISIPSGMSSISFVPYNCVPYRVNGELQNGNSELSVSYDNGDYTDEYSLELPAGVSFSLICNYQERRKIAPVEIAGNVLPFVPTTHWDDRSDDTDLALARLANEAEQITGLTSYSSQS